MAHTLITDSRTAGANYRILRSLGRGGMAQVFLARQEGLEGFRRLVVIKKILPQFSQVPDVARMLLDEARIAAQLNHPNIVQIYELGKEEEQYFIVMEFVDGCDLATLARLERHRHCRIPLRLTLRAVSEAAMGLDYAHRQAGLDGRPLSLVHRDVSPHNVMCSREGAVKVTDFGIAKAVGKAQHTQVGVIKGKVQYMSPEQYTGGEVDHRSDIFSLGVVLYQLTTGRLPRVGDKGEVVMRRVLEGKVPLPSELRPDYPDDLEEIVMRAMAQNPEDRYPDAAALRDDLLQFARENDLLAFPKELADYVNAQVPQVPLVVREQSVINGEEPPAGHDAELADPKLELEPKQELETTEAPSPPSAVSSLQIEFEEIISESPEETSAASPGARRKVSLMPPATEMLIRTPPPQASEQVSAIDDTVPSAELAVLPDEDLTPSRPLDHQRETGRVSAVTRRAIVDPLAPTPGATPAELAAVGGQGVSLMPAFPEDGAGSTGTPVQVSAPTPVGPPPLPRRGLWFTLALALLGVGAAGIAFAIFSKQVRTTEKSGPLELAKAGVINVLANPSSAKVTVDGAQRCASTPCRIGGVPLGRELVLTLKAEGHQLWMQRLVLSAEEPVLLLRADLTPKQPPAAPEAGAKKPTEKRESAVAAKPDSRGKSLKGQASSKPGKQSKASKAKSAQAAAQGEQSGQVVTVDIESDQAVLVIEVRPWAEVWVNGQKVGLTPFQREIPPGTYKVELKNAALKYAESYTIKAAKGKKIKILAGLLPQG